MLFTWQRMWLCGSNNKYYHSHSNTNSILWLYRLASLQSYTDQDSQVTKPAALLLTPVRCFCSAGLRLHARCNSFTTKNVYTSIC